MDKSECLARLNLLGIDCTDSYDITHVRLEGDIFVLNASDAEYGAGYLSHADHRGVIQSTMFLRYEDMIKHALTKMQEKKHG